MLCYRCGSFVPDDAEICKSCGHRLGDSARHGPSTFSRRRVVATAIEGAPYKSGDVLAERYEVKDVRGAGPLGFVFRAHDRELDLEVALKVISKRLIQTDEEREHFSRVIRTGRRLSHQNLARVNEDGLSDDAPFYTSQFLEGLTLRKILEHRIAKNQVFTLHEVEPILTQIAIALQASHRLGPHSDLKPENVIVLPDLLKVTDFGMGVALPRAPFVAALKGRKADRYLAPEWHREGTPIDPRSDTYALGVILGEMLACMTPEGTGIPELHRLRPDLPAAVDGLYRKALSENPSGRFQTPAELINELSAIIKRTPARAQKGAPPPEMPGRPGLSKLQEELPPVPERFIPPPPPPAPPHSNGSSAGGYSKAVRSGNAVVGGAAAMSYASTDGPTLPPDAPSHPRPNGGLTRAPSDHSLDETQPFDVSMLPPEISGLLSDQTQPFDASALPSLPPPRELAQRLRAGLPATQGPDDPGSSPTPRIDARGHIVPAGRSTLPIDEAPPWRPPPGTDPPVSVTPTDGFQTVDDPQAGPLYRVASDAASTLAMDESQLDEVLNPRPLFGAVAPRPAESGGRSNAMLWLALLVAGGVVVGSLGGYLLLSGMRRRPAEPPPPSQGTTEKASAAAAAAAAVAAAAPAMKCPDGMVGIVKGAFKMGTAKDDPMMGFDERALGAVDVEAFCVDEYEYPNRKGEQPMVNVSWSDAKKQCEKKGKRLCTEQEWEKACKGPQSMRFPYGDAFDPNACNTEKKGGDDREISGAGMFPLCASAYGVKDLSGNVAEWTDTLFAGHSDRTQKGGSFDRPDYAARCSARRSGASSAKAPEVGFRCCGSPL